MITTVEKVLFLKSVELFRDLPGEELATIAEIAEEQPFAAGEPVFAEGEPGDALYLVVEGVVRVHRGARHLAQLGVRDVLQERPEIGMGIIQVLSRRLRTTARQP